MGDCRMLLLCSCLRFASAAFLRMLRSYEIVSESLRVNLRVPNLEIGGEIVGELVRRAASPF